jgi:hypothetical protein
VARIIDYRTDPHELLGTARDDAIFIKASGVTVIFGGLGDDEIYTPVDTVQQQIYGGYSFAGFGHLMPNISAAALRRAYVNDGDDIAHGGNSDWMKLGGGADTHVWHPNPGGYTRPGLNIGFDPEEGDTIVFAHDRGFSVGGIVASRIGGGRIDLHQVDLHGKDSDFLLDGEWMRLDFRPDGRGEDNHVILALHGETVRETVRDWLNDHDGQFGHHPDAFIF